MTETQIPQSAQTPDGQLAVVTPDAKVLSKNSIVGFFKHDRRARPFTLLRTQLMKRIETNGLKLIGISSATPGAGKSFVSLNLAASLSRVSDQEIILVDLDLRRASVANLLGFTPEIGMSDYLMGDVPDVMATAQRVEGTKLTILPTRLCTGDTASMITGPIFDDMLEKLRTQTGDAIVIFDLPPAFANDDAMLAIRKIDGYVLVVDSGHNNKKQILNTLAMFSPTPCIGTVLNRYDGGLVDAYGYGYGYGYGKSKYDQYY